MSKVQRGTRAAKARPRWGFAHKGTSAAFPGLAIACSEEAILVQRGRADDTVVSAPAESAVFLLAIPAH